MPSTAVSVTTNKQGSTISEKNQNVFFVKYNSFFNHTTTVTLSNSIEIDFGRANFEPPTSYIFL